MSNSQIGSFIGIGTLLGGVMVVGYNWWQRRKENQARASANKLLNKKSPPGYYVLEGFLDSSDPIESLNKKYARLVCTTTNDVSLSVSQGGNPGFQDYQILSNSKLTMIYQNNPNQILSINGVEVTEYLNNFPLITICDSDGKKVQGLPVAEGKYRLTGHFDGKSLQKMHTRDNEIQCELGLIDYEKIISNTSAPFAWYLITIGSVICIMNFKLLSSWSNL